MHGRLSEVQPHEARSTTEDGPPGFEAWLQFDDAITQHVALFSASKCDGAALRLEHQNRELARVFGVLGISKTGIETVMVQRVDLGVGCADIEIPDVVRTPIMNHLGMTATLAHRSVRNETFR